MTLQDLDDFCRDHIWVIAPIGMFIGWHLTNICNWVINLIFGEGCKNE